MPTFAERFQAQHPIIHTPKNPMDVCTIVSVFPKAIKDNKVTTFPLLPEIPAAIEGEFSLLVVGTTSWFQENQNGGPTIEIPVDSKRTAEAFIRDHVNGLLGFIPEIAAPGLFVCFGKWDKKSIHSYKDPETDESFAELRKKAEARQKRWYQELIRLSDADWARSNGNPLVICEDAKIAANSLRLDKPWIKDQSVASQTNCPACGFMINAAYPICGNCKAIINKDKAKELGIVFSN